MMSNTYDGLLKELGIPRSPGSYETYRRLKEKRAEYQARIGSQNSLEENKRLEQMLNEIGKAESHFEALAKEEKKANKWDGFDYDSLKGKKKKKKRVYIPTPIEDAAQSSEPESVLTFEERYDDIIGFMGTPDGFEAGLEQLRQLGEEGCVEAQKRLGLLYYHGEKTVAADTRESFYWYEKAALQGDALSENQIGTMYMDGIGVEVNREQAMKWLKIAAAGGDEDAPWNLGLLYEIKFEITDYKEALRWYEIAANEFGNIRACNRLGLAYMEEICIEPDRDRAIYWLKKAAESGDPDGVWNLGLAYDQYFEEKDYHEAVKWYEIAANEFANTGAYNNLGIIYMNNNGVGPNREKAIYWLEKASQAGQVYASYNLGRVYEELFEKKDYQKAAYWYEIAANEYGVVLAYNKLGIIYMSNNGVGPDREKAIYWLEKAADAGVVVANWNLGLVYEKRFEEKDYQKAKYWYEKALESGDEDAPGKLGYVYTENGECKIINMNTYLVWLERTAEAEDFASEMKWYEKAAMEYDDADAMFAIGRIYEDKKGDDARAAQWYLKAIQYGNTAAQERFDRLAARTQAQNTKKKEEEKHGAAKFFARWKK